MADAQSVAVKTGANSPENPLGEQRRRRSIKQASARFNKTLAELKELDKRTRVETDPATGWARAVRGKFAVGRPLPPEIARQFRYMISAKELGSHPSAVFLERFSALFGVDEPLDQLFLRGITPLAQGDWFAFGIDIFTVGRGCPAQIDIVVSPRGEVIYAGFGHAGHVPERG